ncbi:MAG: cytochrome P450 [Acidimicrobiales bacterium]|nr:cytochrome P450 [Acidimicrobiales bacterium]
MATASTTHGLDDIDFSDLDFWLRPLDERAAAFARLRVERPIAPMTFPGIPHMGLPDSTYYSVTRHADIVHASRHPELFCSGKGTNIADLPPDFIEFFGSMINLDDPRHARMRRIVSRGFTPRQLELMKTDVEGVAAEIVDEIAERGEADFVTEVAARLPLRIILDMMGIPRSQEEFVFDRTNVILGFTDPEYVDDIEDPMGVTMSILTAGQDLAALVTELGEARIKDPGNDLVSALVTSEVDGEKLSPQELASFFILLVVAGNETTRNALSGGLVAFSRFPDQHRKLIEQPDLIDLAVDEIVRYVSPVMTFMRTVTADHTYKGVDLQAGDRVFLLYQSANRDESVFDEPDEFRVDRDPNPHLGFGIGTHYCLGANLARAEISVVFTELFSRLRDIRAVDPTALDRGDSSLVLAMKHLPAVFTPESRA